MTCRSEETLNMTIDDIIAALNVRGVTVGHRTTFTGQTTQRFALIARSPYSPCIFCKSLGKRLFFAGEYKGRSRNMSVCADMASCRVREAAIAAEKTKQNEAICRATTL